MNSNFDQNTAYATQLMFFNVLELLVDLVNIPALHKNYRKHNHPAYQMWREYWDIVIGMGNLPQPINPEEHARHAKILLDANLLSLCSGGKAFGNIGTNTLGDFAKYGDDKVLKKIKSRVNDSNQFEDLMTELIHAAWYILNQHQVCPFEEEGFPDFKVTLHESGHSYLVDCKRINSSSGDNRYKSVIEKANKQFKKFNRETGRNLPGMILLDLSSKIGVLKRNLSDEPPEEVDTACNALNPHIRHFNSAVGGILVVWEESIVLGEENLYKHGTMVNFNRRSLLLRHQNPEVELPSELDGMGLHSWSSGVWVNSRILTSEELEMRSLMTFDNYQWIDSQINSQINLHAIPATAYKEHYQNITLHVEPY
ncbi:hypothetical protein [Pseudanabaena sp. FACHB-2040]|uniref:hypothetical protein n=1 Tax=Pseudanabaena sp. FACHB-2040 TaxID=2692859 RepID=UPI001686581A|nr:hypothetical protein [Pseudanabaena sp. FACHB-2040]MBD2259893.1 hypothetical protein [Pseudanabaena sp. FACHB-2040]